MDQDHRRCAGVGGTARLGLDRLHRGQHRGVRAVVLDDLVVRAGDRAVLVAGALVEVDPVQRADPLAGAELGQGPRLARLHLPLQEDAGPRHTAGGLTGLEARDGHGELLVDMGKMSTRNLRTGTDTHRRRSRKRIAASAVKCQVRATHGH
jgi:hypothetical protein